MVIKYYYFKNFQSKYTHLKMNNSLITNSSLQNNSNHLETLYNIIFSHAYLLGKYIKMLYN